MRRTAGGGGKPAPACRAYNPDLWFPLGWHGAANELQIEQAKLVCFGCPLRIACLEYALASNEADGIYGGFTPSERRGMRGVEGGRDELLEAMVSA